MKITEEQIREILDDTLNAEEQTFLGDPSHPIVTGKDEAVKRLIHLFEFITTQK